ncbi:hypothetical protein ASPWEDRAFT_108589 [Aspergillus wentii DTO 134E9]|uniref:Pal1 cell morphology protein n=1 Tax=Aspergillus wentii DTO 134E9 TaxID=1073089 RepID=A0A1L9RNH8_ASPWE|nr:uncharacterized protein ASPWEDRAFT_108589 [Aspergillus wentii DTO 134E9]OJJ36500.1 hypothetical protein ASPWEDRAFT_108589 [Aspergillus wentii DTO 134E9]
MSPVERQDLTGNTRDLFENLSLNRPPQNTGHRPAPAPPRPDNAQKFPPSSRAPQRDPSRRREQDPFDIFADPPNKATSSAATKPTRETRDRERQRERRPQRRNSESSIMEKTPKLLDTEEERRRRERRRREREGRPKDGKSRSKKANYQLDIIDKLDVTSIYGTGMFHHDGPFDACNPNRNRKGLRTAPMQAFPKDSSNMALGGAGPVNKNIDLNLFNGTMTEGYNDFASSGLERRAETVNFDPTSRIEPVHGSESMGLGTSTFLDGAPASRSAMQRRVSENETGIQNGGGGLQRKKSLAQRLRGMNRPPPGRMISPEPSTPVQASSSHSGSNRPNEKNPFFQDYDDAWDQKGARINVAEESREPGRARSASSPKQRTIERRFTDERSYDEAKNNNSGFLNRMKSLRKPKPERRTSED